MGTLADCTTERAPFHGMKTPVALNPVLHGATFQTGTKVNHMKRSEISMAPHQQKMSAPAGVRSDVYVLSFPKCGRTWLRMMLAKTFALMDGEDVSDYFAYAPAPDRNMRIIFDHEDSGGLSAYDALETDKTKYKNEKVLFLVRDARDVMVSYYFQMTRRTGNALSFKNIASFIRNEICGIDTLLTYMNIWENSRHIPSDFLLVRYEDMHDHPHLQLKRVLEFIGLAGVSDEVIKTAVDFAQFDNMKALEKAGSMQARQLTPGDVNDPESYKARRGKIGGYTDYLGEEDLHYLNQKIRRNLSRYFGYE